MLSEFDYIIPGVILLAREALEWREGLHYIAIREAKRHWCCILDVKVWRSSDNFGL
jgi:hypothetical protein